jgi:hypothetical protein
MGVDTKRATEGLADVLDSTSRSPTERNAVDMPGAAGAVESREKCGLGRRSGDVYSFVSGRAGGAG